MFVTVGGSTTISWDASNAYSCRWSGNVGNYIFGDDVGSFVVGPLTRSTRYNLKCVGPGGTRTASIRIVVVSNLDPTVSFSADTLPAYVGDTATLSWRSTNALSCKRIDSNGGSESIQTSGSSLVRILQRETTFTIRCTGQNKIAEASVLVRVGDAPIIDTPIINPPSTSNYGRPTVSISSDASSVASGKSATLTWTSTNATYCTRTNAAGAFANTPVYGAAFSEPIWKNTTFRIRCSGPGGVAFGAVTVNAVPPISPQTWTPSINLAASKTTVNSGESVTLTWSASNANTCEQTSTTGNYFGNINTSGSVSTGPLTASTTFYFNCSGSYGSSKESITVNVLPVTTLLLPTVTMTAASSTVSMGSSAVLIWNAVNATTCERSNVSGAFESVPVSGNAFVGPLSTTTSFYIRCTGPGGYSQAYVTVGVNNSSGTVIGNGGTTGVLPTVVIAASPSTVQSGGQTTLLWNATNATSCERTDASGNTVALPVSGSTYTGNVYTTTTFRIRCSGSSGYTDGWVTVNVQ